MRTRCLACLRNHIHVLLLLPLIIIVVSWPTAAHVIDADEFWVHNDSWSIFHRVWDSWHLGQVLAGQAELWYSVDTFHPQGVSLAFQHFSFPHALLLLALKPVMPADNAINLLFLLILCFNGFSAYVLILHLLKDKWVALFGAVVMALGISFSDRSSVADLICIGTIPLALYFLDRAFCEGRGRLAALAGFCAGITAFIGMYTFVYILIGAAAYAAFSLPTRWRQPEFWRLLLMFGLICAAISSLRLYPIVAESAIYREGLAKYDNTIRSNDLLNYVFNSGNTFFGERLHSLFNVRTDGVYTVAFLGYINVFFLACALLRTGRRKRLLPWLTLFVFFAVMQLGDFLTYNGIAYRDIVLPARVLRDIFPIPFGQIAYPNYYLYGLITPFAVLSCFGLAALIRGRSARTRALAALAAVLVVSFEFYGPIAGLSVPKGATTFVEWLKSEPDNAIKLINLPRLSPTKRYGLYIQSLTGYPTAYGNVWRNRGSVNTYLDRNWLLREWRKNRSGSCFGREQAYREALDQLLSEGFTHLVLHRWGLGTKIVRHGFARTPIAYDDGLVNIYRLRDMRLACADMPGALGAFDHFLNSTIGEWQPGSSLLSFHPRDRMDEDQWAYLDASIDFTTEWDGLLHLYVDEGEPTIQAAVDSDLTLADFTEHSQQVYVVYDARESDPAQITSLPPLDQFHKCGSQTLEGGWAVEHLLRSEFSCELFTAPAPLAAHYDNGAYLANLLVNLEQEHLEFQMRWNALPETRHTISLQLFDLAGSKVHNQDFVVEDLALARHQLDISGLPPGQYAVKLIFYDFYAGGSVSGAVSATDLRFERELEIATIEWIR